MFFYKTVKAIFIYTKYEMKKDYFHENKLLFLIQPNLNLEHFLKENLRRKDLKGTRVKLNYVFLCAMKGANFTCKKTGT